MPTDLQHTEAETAAPELPNDLFLAPSRTRWVTVLCLSLLVIGLNLFVLFTQEARALGALAMVFGVTAAAAGVQLIPGSAGIWFDRKGFTFRMFWMDRRREWNEVSPILSSQVGFLQMVGYNRAGDAPNKPREVLPDTYGMSAGELAYLMNQWRNAAIQGQPV